MLRTIDADVLKAGLEEDGHLSPYIEEFIDACPTVEVMPMDFHERCMQLSVHRRIQAEKAVPKWISVKDRLPDECTPVLCCRKFLGVADILEYGLVHGKMCFYYFDEEGFAAEVTKPDVTHWMPLPEPPKEG